MNSFRCVAALTAIGLVTALAGPASVSAATFCVNDPACVAGGGANQATLQSAFNAADSNGANLDRVEIGGGTYTDGPFLADATNPVELVGAGRDQTVLTRTATGFGTILRLEHAQATVSDLGIQLNQSMGMGLIGASVAGTASRIAVTDPTGAGAHTGVSLSGPGATLRASSVSLGTSGTNGVSGSPGSGAPLMIEDVALTAANGINAVGPLEARRVRIAGATNGIITSGAVLLDQLTIRLVGAGSGVNVLPNSSSFGGAQLTLRHLTALGPNAGTGISIVAGCTSGTNLPLPASAQIRNTIVRGFEDDLARSGSPSCGISGDVPAAIDIAHSIYDPTKEAVFSEGSTTVGAGNLNTDPMFADPASGDLHLAAGSPAIDAGDTAAPGAGDLTVDLDGSPRVVDGNADGTAVRDIGAFELQPPPAPPQDPLALGRKLNGKYSARSEEFKGKLKSTEPACRSGKVKLFRRRPGRDPREGADKTNAKGKWLLEAEQPAPGRYYAKAAAKEVAAGTCPEAVSRVFKVG